MPHEILYCHATRQTRKVGAGHWFFHTGQWAQCAEAGKSKDGHWYVLINFAPFGKTLPPKDVPFGSIEESSASSPSISGQKSSRSSRMISLTRMICKIVPREF
jgi:hypothetical protein